MQVKRGGQGGPSIIQGTEKRMRKCKLWGSWRNRGVKSRRASSLMGRRESFEFFKQEDDRANLDLSLLL